MPALPFELSPSLAPLGVFVLSLLILYWVSQQVAYQIQAFFYYLTHSEDMVTVGIFLAYLPGVFIHESAHWVMARLLGLKTGKFRVWPQRRGGSIGMGSVNVQTGGVWRDSLVGMAPLIVGSILVTLIAQQAFSAYRMTDAWTQGAWGAGLQAFWQGLGGEDGLLWAYLLFAIANAMMPSASDRQPLKSLILYVIGAAVLYLILGLPSGPLTSVLDWTAPFLLQLTGALLFTLLLDAIVIVVLWLVTRVIRIFRG
jgi:hypothetical protein